MKKKEIKYIVTTIDGKQHQIIVSEAEETLYDNFSFDSVVVDANTKERINPACIITIRKID